MASSNGNIFPPRNFAIRVTAAAAAAAGGTAGGQGQGQHQHEQTIITRRRMPLKRILRDGNVPSVEKLKTSLKRFYGESFRLTYSDPLDGEMIDLSEDDELLDAIEQFSATGDVLNLNLTMNTIERERQQPNNTDSTNQSSSRNSGVEIDCRDRAEQQHDPGNNIQQIPRVTSSSEIVLANTFAASVTPENPTPRPTRDNAPAGDGLIDGQLTKNTPVTDTVKRHKKRKRSDDNSEKKNPKKSTKDGTDNKTARKKKKKQKGKKQAQTMGEKRCGCCGWKKSEKPDWHRSGVGNGSAVCECPDVDKYYNRDRMYYDETSGGWKLYTPRQVKSMEKKKKEKAAKKAKKDAARKRKSGRR